MRIEEIEVGQILTSVCEVREGFLGLPISPGTPGIVVKITAGDDVYVEFEMVRRITSRAVLCHPVHLRPL
jgi:hypothetical protein